MSEFLPASAAPRARILASYSVDAERSPEWLRVELRRLAETAEAALLDTDTEVIFVDAGRTTEDPVELVDAFDGVLVLGGADLDPAFYGQEPEEVNGTIEAVESADGWVLGVQWHPEDPDADAAQLVTLMSEFAAQCAVAPVVSAQAVAS